MTLPLYINKLENKKVAIYGAKNMGEIVGKLLRHYKLQIACYIVSDGQAHSNKLNDVEIKELNQASSMLSKDTPIILALNKCYHAEVIVELKKKGFENIIDSMIEDQVVLFQDIYRSIIEKNGCVIKEGFLSKENYRQIDPFTDKRLNSFFLEAGDLFLPGICENQDWFTEGPYELGNIQIQQEDVVIDCGANIGIFSCYAASKGASKVYAFEPLPAALEVLDIHKKMYSGIVEIVPFALSDSVGKIDMCISDVSDGEGSIVFEHMIGKKIEVEMTTIDEYVRKNAIERVDFIKADIEGAERQMLKGAYWVLKNMHPKLSICTYHLPDDKEILENLILEANPNYVVEHRYKKLYAYVPEEG